MKSSILEYYNNLAKLYDENRFGNSYGKYIDKQERFFLTSFFKNKKYSTVLDLGCGTGRLLNFATHGTDFSDEMLNAAKEKYPEKKIAKGEISKVPFDIYFDCIFCFHVIMHQNKEDTKVFLDECHQKVKENGILIFDYPTQARRKTISDQESWHANNHFTTSEMSEFLENKWEINQLSGILFSPIHRLPKRLRKYFLPLDIFLCKTFLKKWASYHIIVLEKI